MLAYQRGDLAALGELIARHERPLWNFLRRFVTDPAAAEDLLQETFMRVVKNGSRFRPQAKFSTWLYAIARNLCIDHARRMTHRRAVSLDGKRNAKGPARDSDPDAQLHEALPGNEPGGERRAMDRELGAGLDRAVAALPEAQREVFLMREVLGMPFAEIAQTVGASEPTVKSRMRYALEALRGALSEFRDPQAQPEVSR